MMYRTQEITTSNAPKPVASYSQGVRRGNILAVAGQVGFDPATGELVGPDVRSQTSRALQNVRAVLAAGGASMEDVVMMRVYLVDPSDFPAMNEVYEAFLATPPFPARTTVFVGLGPGMRVEMDALAFISE